MKNRKRNTHTHFSLPYEFIINEANERFTQLAEQRSLERLWGGEGWSPKIFGNDVHVINSATWIKSLVCRFSLSFTLVYSWLLNFILLGNLFNPLKVAKFRIFNFVAELIRKDVSKKLKIVIESVCNFVGMKSRQTGEIKEGIKAVEQFNDDPIWRRNIVTLICVNLDIIFLCLYPSQLGNFCIGCEWIMSQLINTN